MFNYLGSKTADYTTTTLQVSPQVSLPMAGDKSQVMHDLDDGSLSVVGLSSTSFFDVQLQWSYINETDKVTIMDFWHNPLKADGRRRTFYWLHPTDGHTYTAQFTSPLIVEQRPGTMGIQTITLRVTGVKP